MTRYIADDIRGIVAILPTPALPGADRWDAVDTVDLMETERMTRALVDAGVDVVLTNGTFGEGASLTQREILAFNEVVVQTVAGRVPVFGGATTLNTRDTVARGRALTDVGVDGLFLGRPMWVALDGRQIVDFHTAIAEALPGQSQIVYDNPSAFKGKIASETYGALSRIPQIVAAKHMGFTLMGDRFVADLKAVAGRIRLLALADDWVASARRFPDQVLACWSGDAACGPAPLLALRDALQANDWDSAQVVNDDIAYAIAPLFPDGDFEVFSRYNIQIDRAEFAAAGWITPGPCRPPYTTAPDNYLACGTETGTRWKAMQTKYARQPASVSSPT